jgi:CubicO group peptidase (beta-lactamase class C family)
LLLSCLFDLARAADIDAAAAPADISATLSAIAARRHIPGMTAVVLRGDRIIAQGAAGVRKQGATEAVLLTDRFEIASNVKPMSALVLAMLIEEGRLRWDSTLSEIFGGTLRGMHPAWRGVTMRQLMDHRSGLPGDPIALLLSRTLLSTASPTRERLDIVEHVLAHPPQYPPDTKLSYTSTSYLVLAAAMEKATGQAWEDLMRDRLFGPLGMTTVGLGTPAAPHRLDQPWGHGYRFHFPVFGFKREVPLDPASALASLPRAVAPVGGVVHMSAPDWAKFVALVLRGQAANPERHVALLSADSFARLYDPDPRNEVPRGWGGGRYTANWIATTRSWARGSRPDDVGRLLWNQGDDTRWHSTAYIAPEINFAVVIACNRSRQWEAGHEVAEALVGEFALNERIPGSSLSGRWEGLVGGQRVALELGDVATSEAMLVLPDQEKERIPITTLTEREGNVRFSASKAGGFDGTLNPEKSVLAGTWTKGQFVRWVIFKRRSAAGAVGND